MLSLNGTKAVFFDLDNTLRTRLPNGREFFIAYAQSLGIPIAHEDFLLAARWEAYYWAESPELHADVKLFEQSEDAFYLNYSRRQLVILGCDAQQAAELAEDVHAHMRAHYKPVDWVSEELPALLTSLREAGLKLAVVSNRMTAYDDYLKEKGLDGYFDFSVAAGLIKSWKPDAGIFLHALKLAGVKPHEAVYVGDNYFADVLGARNAGLKPILLDPQGVFDAPGCPVIRWLGEVPDLLQRM